MLSIERERCRNKERPVVKASFPLCWRAESKDGVCCCWSLGGDEENESPLRRCGDAAAVDVVVGKASW